MDQMVLGALSVPLALCLLCSVYIPGINFLLAEPLVTKWLIFSSVHCFMQSLKLFFCVSEGGMAEIHFVNV